MIANVQEIEIITGFFFHGESESPLHITCESPVSCINEHEGSIHVNRSFQFVVNLSCTAVTTG